MVGKRSERSDASCLMPVKCSAAANSGQEPHSDPRLPGSHPRTHSNQRKETMESIFRRSRGSASGIREAPPSVKRPFGGRPPMPGNHQGAFVSANREVGRVDAPRWADKMQEKPEFAPRFRSTNSGRSICEGSESRFDSLINSSRDPIPTEFRSVSRRR